MQCEKDLEESRLQAERGCGTIIPFRLIGASEVERSHDGDGVAETSSWLPADSQFEPLYHVPNEFFQDRRWLGQH